MRSARVRLALLALVLPVFAPGAAHANQNLNNCTVAAGGTVTSFSATCAGVAAANPDSGAYSFTFTWPVNPCLTSGPMSGTVTGSGPYGTFGPGAALAVVNPGGVNDLNFGFQQNNGSNTGRHTGFFQFTCSFNVGVVNMSGGQISEIEAVSAVPSAPGSAYCPYGSVNGNAAYSPGAGTTGSSTLTMTLALSCIGAGGAGLGGGAGTYAITLSGPETGGCYSGNGAGAISGTGPGGVISGAWTYSRNAVHYYGFPPTGTGYIRMGGKVYGFYLWLDIVPAAGQTCPLYTGTVVGHGLVVA
jgi:hypothetical protein